MTKELIAIDRSARTIDADGRLHVERSHISKAAVNPYYGAEIPRWQELGLQADKIYYLLRDPVELERAAPTFARLPILSKHVPHTVEDVPKELVVGAIGSGVRFVHPYLDADVCVWDEAAIAGIDSGDVREFSCGYRYVAVMEPGEFEGTPYDGRMTEIRGNHLALVEVGRAGPDVYVADSNPFKDGNAMKKTKLGHALFVALSAASPVLAADSALPALVGNADRKTFKKAEVKAKLLAMDSDMNPEQVDNIVDAILGVEESPLPIQPTPPAKDADPVAATPADKLRQILAGKVDEETLNAALACIAPAAGDEYPDNKPVDVAGAMDSLRREFREANEARNEVRSVVGDVVGMDSAAEIYGFALDHMKVDHSGVEGAPALRALFKVAAGKQTEAPAPRIAQDAAGLLEAFPAAGRFRQA